MWHVTWVGPSDPQLRRDVLLYLFNSPLLSHLDLPRALRRMLCLPATSSAHRGIVMVRLKENEQNEHYACISSRRHREHNHHAASTFQSRIYSRHRCECCERLAAHSSYRFSLFGQRLCFSSTKQYVCAGKEISSTRQSRGCRFLDSDRLESSEREAALFKGQVSQAFVAPASESELYRTYTAKKSAVSSQNSARLTSSSRTPLIANVRKLSNEDTPIVPLNDGPFSRSLPQVAVTRSKSFQNGQSILAGTAPANSSDEVTLLRSYKAHLEQVLRKDAPPYSDLKVPSYASIEEVIKANEVCCCLFFSTSGIVRILFVV